MKDRSMNRINHAGHRHRHRRGFALLSVLALTMVSTAAVLSYSVFCSNEMAGTRRTLDYQKAKIIAESGLEYGVLKLRETMLAYQFELSSTALQNVLNQIPPPDDMGNYHFITPDGDVSFSITADTDPVDDIISQGTTCLGQFGTFQDFTITCGVLNTNTGVGAVLRQKLQALSVFMIRFGVFYEEDLEILPGPQMIFTGPVHCNANIYIDADSGPVRCTDRVTAAEDIYHHRKDVMERRGDVYIQNGAGINVSMVEGSTVIDSHHPDWMPLAVQRWDGRVLSSAHNIQKLAPPINPLDNPHVLIERPDFTAPADDATEKEKFSRKAGLYIHVDTNNVLSATNFFGDDVSARFTNAVLVFNGNANGKPLYRKSNADDTYLMETNGAYDLTQLTLYDDREDRDIAILDIYVDQLLATYPEIADPLMHAVTEGLGIVYVTRDDPAPDDDTVMPAVRIRNGVNLPDCGLSIVSDLPVYVEGDYNVVDSPPMPALIAGDTVTLLSVNWQDAKSKGTNQGGRPGKDTAYNTVIMTGNEPTAPSDYNGGLENVLRFLERWTSKTVTFRGSIICLWTAQIADGPWEYGNYYTAPNRDWGYDVIYKSAAPPGMTRVFGLEEIAWDTVTWQTAAF